MFDAEFIQKLLKLTEFASFSLWPFVLRLVVNCRMGSISPKVLLNPWPFPRQGSTPSDACDHLASNHHEISVIAGNYDKVDDKLMMQCGYYSHSQLRIGDR
jgi:hypothetical protein